MNHAPHSSTHADAMSEMGATIARMDLLSKNGFTAIAAIARRALANLEGASEASPSTVVLAAALDSIWQKAEFFGNEINMKAEEAGCNWSASH